MNYKHLLIAILAGAALVGCNKEAGKDEPTGIKSQYMAFHIAVPSVTKGTEGSPAAYSYGTDAENAIKSIYFFFYRDGAYISYGKGEVATAFSPATQDAGGNVEEQWRKSDGKGVVVIENSMNTKPNQLLCIVNSPKPEFFRNKTLASALEALQTGLTGVTGNESYTEIGFARLESSTPYFCMTNSPVIVGGVAQYALPFTESKIYYSAAEAEADPVEVNVERMASKVEVKALTAATDPTLTAAGWTITLNNWGLNGVSKQSYVVKKIDAAWAAQTAIYGSWLVGPNRVNWAIDPDYASTDFSFNNKDFYPESAEIYGQTGSDGITPIATSSRLLYYSKNQIDAHAANTHTYDELRQTYCLENTFNKEGQNDPRIVGTSVLVLATVVPTTTGVATDLYNYLGVMYTLDSYAAHLLTNVGINHKFYVDNGMGGYRAINASDLEIRKAVKGATFNVDGYYATTLGYSDGWVTLYPKPSVTLKTYDAVTDTYSDADAADINEAFLHDIQGLANAYKGGAMWYTIPVEHLGSATDASGKLEGNYGIVRNHYYQINLGTIKSLGHGIYDPNEPIVPGDKTETWYLGAKINVNAWHVVVQNSNLEE